jgi:hypothetical protein
VVASVLRLGTEQAIQGNGVRRARNADAEQRDEDDREGGDRGRGRRPDQRKGEAGTDRQDEVGEAEIG